MKSRFATLVLVTWLGLGVAAQDWGKKENLEADPGRPHGWRFEVPVAWRKAALANFPYPIGEAWNGTDGGFQVCWLGDTPKVGQEQINLLNKGFTREDKRVAGREAILLKRPNELFCYIRTTKGSCRLHVNGPTTVSDHILDSFVLVDLADTATGGEQKYGDWAFELPPGWRWKEPDLIVASDDEPVARLGSYPLSRDMMVRGWARTQASQENPALKERIEMEPFTSKKGVDGYLVEWKGPKGSLLFAYTALKGKGVRFELLRTEELEKLRRLLSSLQFRG